MKKDATVSEQKNTISEERLIECMSQILGMSQKDYCYAQQVYSNGIPALIDALDEYKIPLELAAEISELPTAQQQKRLKICFEHHDSHYTKSTEKNIYRYRSLVELRKRLGNMTQDEVTDYIAALVGMRPEDYLHAQQVYLNGIPALMKALDEHKIPFTVASEISKLPAFEQQEACLKEWLENHATVRKNMTKDNIVYFHKTSEKKDFDGSLVISYMKEKNSIIVDEFSCVAKSQDKLMNVDLAVTVIIRLFENLFSSHPDKRIPKILQEFIKNLEAIERSKHVI